MRYDQFWLYNRKDSSCNTIIARNFGLKYSEKMKIKAI